MEMLSSKYKTAIIIAGVVVVGIFIFYMTTKTKAYDYSITNEVIENNISEEKEVVDEEKSKEIIIHITGAVKKEGIVKLKEGSRIVDAIEEAGGLTEEAELKEVNLAYVLKDGQKIYIPKISDVETEITVAEDNGINVIMDTGMEEPSNTKININTADVNQLSNLSGIGEKMAIKIIEYREANGNFKSIEDIKNVSGIGDSKYESIKNDICI